jgi:L-threonylcarbamoyladenylate synthase
VREHLEGKLDFVLDGGRCPGGKESTIVDVTGEQPIILRPGIIPATDIDQAYREYLEAKRCALP